MNAHKPSSTSRKGMASKFASIRLGVTQRLRALRHRPAPAVVFTSAKQHRTLLY